MSVNEKYDKLYKALAVKINRKNATKWKSTGKIFPSSAGVECELNLRFGFVGAEKTMDFVWHGIENKIGDAIHEVIQNNFKDQFQDKVENEKYISIVVEGVKINGKVDIILKLEGDKYVIIEIKTVKASEGKEADLSHIKQVQWYMGILGIHKAVISYFNRENGIHIQTFEVEFDQRMFDKIKEKFARVIRGDKDLRSDTRECKYCLYKKICSQYKPVPKWHKKK